MYYLIICKMTFTKCHFVCTKGNKIMFCSNCGSNLSEEDKYCPKCGTLNQQSRLSHTSVPPDYFKQDIPIKQTKSDDNNFAIPGFVFAFIFPIIGLI